MARHIAFLVLCFWLVVTALWWTFAFWPVAEAPEWLAAARLACFGSMPDTGLPDAGGWLMLTAAPLSMLVALLVAWGSDIRTSLKLIFSRPGNRLLLAVVLLIFVVHAFWLGSRLRDGIKIANLEYTSDLKGNLPTNYPVSDRIAPDFTLTDQHSRTVHLKELVDQGYITVVSFAFANCKTICPAITRNLTEAIAEFDPEQVKLLIVTLDPHRDTITALESWSRRLKLPKNAFLVTGTAEQIEYVLDQYQIPHKRDQKTGDVDHPALTNVIDGNGKIIYALGNVPARWITDAIIRVMDNSVLASSSDTGQG